MNHKFSKQTLLAIVTLSVASCGRRLEPMAQMEENLRNNYQLFSVAAQRCLSEADQEIHCNSCLTRELQELGVQAIRRHGQHCLFLFHSGALDSDLALAFSQKKVEWKRFIDEARIVGTIHRVNHIDNNWVSLVYD